MTTDNRTNEPSEFGDAATVAFSPKADKDREKLIAEAWDKIGRRLEPDSFYDPPGKTEGFNLAQQVMQPVVEKLINALAAQPVLDAENDLRDVAHIACDCVPELGPEHCHLCSDREGHEVAWAECSSHHLDRERVKTWLQREFGSVLAHDPHNPERFWGGSARALCEAAKRGELSA